MNNLNAGRPDRLGDVECLPLFAGNASVRLDKIDEEPFLRVIKHASYGNQKKLGSVVSDHS